MRRGYPLFLTVFLALVAVGCTSTITSGNGLLPEGMEEAEIPNLDVAGYMYLNADPPLALSTSRFGSPDAVEGNVSEALDSRVGLTRATLVVDSTPDNFGGVLGFASESDAQDSWTLLQDRLVEHELWGELSSSGVLLVRGGGLWADSVREALVSENQIAIPDHDPVAWALLTNLPENPPSQPIAAGVLKLDGGLLALFGERADIDLDGVDVAFGFVRVDIVGFGVYAELPLDVPERIDEEFLINSGSGILFVSHSDYAGALVSFMIGVVAGRTDMETVQVGGLNAKYRTLDNLHLIIKNRGSLIYAALAGEMALAEELILSAFDN